MLNINNSIQGLRSATNDFNKSADRISKSGLIQNTQDDSLIQDIEDKITLTNNDETIDVAKEFIKMELIDVCYKANAKVIKTSDDMIGTVIDLKA